MDREAVYIIHYPFCKLKGAINVGPRGKMQPILPKKTRGVESFGSEEPYDLLDSPVQPLVQAIQDWSKGSRGGIGPARPPVDVGPSPLLVASKLFIFSLNQLLH